MNAFLTGSRKYGTPRDDSNVDLVILTDGVSLHKLSELADDAEEHKSPGYGALPRGKSLRFGKLNLIAVTDPVLYATWVVGTEQLWQKKQEAIGYPKGWPTRDEAKKVLEGLRISVNR